MESKYSKVILKKLTPLYLEDYFKLLSDPQIRKTTEPFKVYQDPVKVEINHWLESLRSKKDRSDFAIFDSLRNQFIGEVVVSEILKKKANIRISISTEQQNKGFGFEAMKLAIEYAFEQLGLEELTLRVFNLNLNGLRLSKKLNFIEIQQSVFEGFEETIMKLEKMKEPPKKKRYEQEIV